MGEETRTLDSHLGKVVLYQLSYAHGGTQTRSIPIRVVNRFFDTLSLQAMHNLEVEDLLITQRPGQGHEF